MSTEPHSAVVSRSPTLRPDELEGVEKLDTPGVKAPDEFIKKEDVKVFEQSLPPLAAPTFSDFPDGGLKAWLQVVGSFFLIFAAWYACPTYTLTNGSTHFRMGTAGETSMHLALFRPTMRRNCF